MSRGFWDSLSLVCCIRSSGLSFKSSVCRRLTQRGGESHSRCGGNKHPIILPSHPSADSSLLSSVIPAVSFDHRPLSLFSICKGIRRVLFSVWECQRVHVFAWMCISDIWERYMYYMFVCVCNGNFFCHFCAVSVYLMSLLNWYHLIRHIQSSVMKF